MVGIVMGSRSDEALMQPAVDTLQQLGIEHEVSVISAHRNPEQTREYGLQAADRGLEVIIAGAGKAAHLPGVLAGWSTLPVIGVPLSSGSLMGVESLYSMAEMPPGVPVACVAIDGAKNAALMAAAILGLRHRKVREAYEDYRQRQSQPAAGPSAGGARKAKRGPKRGG